jgi:hypothetical protein
MRLIMKHSDFQNWLTAFKLSRDQRGVLQNLLQQPDSIKWLNYLKRMILLYVLPVASLILTVGDDKRACSGIVAAPAGIAIHGFLRLL